MNSAKNGFLGDPNGSCGLIDCLSEHQTDIIIKEAQKQGIVFSEQELKKFKIPL